MPVHFTVASHDAWPVNLTATSNSITKPEELLHRTWGVNLETRCAELLQSSFVNNGSDFSVQRASSSHYQVRCRYLLYSNPNAVNLIDPMIRPDDVWIAILASVNAHAEELRSHFVQHVGKKELAVEAVGTRYTVNLGVLAHQMTKQIHQNVVDRDLQEWILPDFTTSTYNDTIICSVLMMSTLKTYFDFEMGLMCGIPSVALEGEKSDWERLLARLDKLDSFGEEPKAWATLLRPILTRFVAAFDGEPDIDFWSRVCYYHPQGSGPTYLSGWITAFCVWSNEGKWQGSPRDVMVFQLWDTKKVPELVLDGVSYPTIESEEIPVGFCEVDVKLDDNGVKFPCVMVSGHLALSVEGAKKDSIRPLPSWFMFIKEKIHDQVAPERL